MLLLVQLLGQVLHLGQEIYTFFNKYASSGLIGLIMSMALIGLVISRTLKIVLENKIDSYPYELSGGEKQRLAIARTLAINPKIICFDEPTSALDPKLVKQVFKIIKELSAKGKAILIVTHDIKFANDISNRTIEIGNKKHITK